LLKVAYEGEIDYFQILNEEGEVDESLFPKDLSNDKLLEMYKQMSLARTIDAKALSLQRQGRIVTYAPLIGEEATQIGSAMAMRASDCVVPNFRQHGVLISRGMSMIDFFISWRGYEDGAAKSSYQMLPYAVPVSTQMLHATGLAYAMKYRKMDAAVVAYVGDGGTSEGDFYECMNFAGVLNVPLVIIIENNQWAISVPRKEQTAAQTLAQKAIAAGIPSIQVDGNDVIGVYKAVSDAIANSNNTPTVIECITYRMSLHTTADDPTKYRPDSEVEAWKPKDPILRLRKYLNAKGLLNDALEKEMSDKQAADIDKAIAEAEKFKGDPKSMFNNLYSFIPDVLKDEEDAAIAAGFWQ
jgi:pyruvate dehydrogenase E1 component alpha subunit